MFRFYDTVYFWGLAAIPLLATLYLYVIIRKKKTARKIGDAQLVQLLTQNHSPGKALLKFTLVTAAIALCALALANLKKPQGSADVTLNGIDVMLAIDVSKSMMAQDIMPNRLERAKQLLNRLSNKLENNRLGIVVFAGHAYIQMPLTADNNAARLYISSINPAMVPVQGTVLGEALKMCFNAFSGNEKKYKAVILISDGEDHDENANSIAQAMAEEGVVIHTVGIGSPQGAPIIDETTNEIKKDKDGNTVITKLNETALQEIASKGKGSYQLFTSSDEVAANLEKQLNNMEKRAVRASSSLNYTYFFPWFLLAALLLLVTEIFITEKKRLKKASMAVAVLLYLLCPTTLQAQDTKAQLKKANEAYNQKEYEKAADGYKSIVAENAADAVAQYNLGNAHFKNGNYTQALQAYNQALQADIPSSMHSAIYYNQGVALQKSNQLEPCIAAYKKALKISPDDADARLNLQKALQQLKKQQEQQKNKPKQKPKPDPKQKEKEPQEPKDKKDELPKPRPSKLTKKQAEEKLKALLQEEKNLHEKLRKAQISTLEKPEKDW